MASSPGSQPLGDGRNPPPSQVWHPALRKCCCEHAALVEGPLRADPELALGSGSWVVSCKQGCRHGNGVPGGLGEAEGQQAAGEHEKKKFCAARQGFHLCSPQTFLFFLPLPRVLCPQLHIPICAGHGELSPKAFTSGKIKIFLFSSSLPPPGWCVSSWLRTTRLRSSTSSRSCRRSLRSPSTPTAAKGGSSAWPPAPSPWAR